MTRILVLALALLASGCTGVTYAAGDMGTCYVDAFNAFCQVKTPPNTSIVAGTGLVPGTGTMVYGIGSLVTGIHTH